jgi:NAD(P)-dependent dehydrogenase (short-subunit alcohol dehydrogenase family)
MKTVCITGISRGIGRALAGKFLKEGYLVIGTSTTGRVDFSHGQLSVVELNLTSAESIAKCAEQVVKVAPHLDILINNAGALFDDEETEVMVEKLRQTLEVNLIGTIDLTEHMLPLLSHGSHIVNISSSAGSLERTAGNKVYYPSYKISKAALNMYTRTLALRLKDEGVTVSSVHPGWVRTEMGGDDADISVEEAADGIYDTAINPPETGNFWFRGECFPW